MRIETIDPIAEPAWEEFVRGTEHATAFHSAAWAKVLHDTYDFEPRYLVARNGGGITAGMPLFWVNGKRLVGLPFSDLCPPLLPESSDGEALIAAAKAAVENGGAKALELRGAPELDLESRGLHKTASFLQHTLPIDAPLAELEARMRSSVRRAIAQARSAGLTVRRSTSGEDMQRFYALNIKTRRKHGLVPQPWRFFQSIQRHAMEEGEGFLLLCDLEGVTIAADLLLAHGGKLVSKFNASDASFLSLRPNHLIFQATIELALAEGYTSIHLGRTDLDHAGLRRFKLSFGSEEQPLDYYGYPAESAGSWSTASAPPGHRLMAWFVRYAPSWALRLAGSVLYKHAA